MARDRVQWLAWTRFPKRRRIFLTTNYCFLVACVAHPSTLQIEVVSPSETSANFCCSTGCYISEGYTVLFSVAVTYVSRGEVANCRSFFTHKVTLDKNKGRDSSVGITADYGLDGRGKKLFSSPQRPDQFWGPPSLLYSGHRGNISLGIMRSGRQADHSPTPNADVKNGGAIPPPPHTS
jgi:hypothetical protein